MQIKLIERLKFKISGTSSPVIRVSDVGEYGEIKTIQIVGQVRDRPNSLINTWDEKGWEKSPGVPMITLIEETGIKKLTWVVSESGRTVNLFTDPVKFPNREDVIGKAATMDDIADSMDLRKSMKNVLIGAIASAPLWWILFQVFGVMMR